MEELENLSKKDLIIVVAHLREHLLKVTLNLGHPAYGISSSTTDGIDKLREETLDYLEVPKV